MIQRGFRIVHAPILHGCSVSLFCWVFSEEAVKCQGEVPRLPQGVSREAITLANCLDKSPDNRMTAQIHVQFSLAKEPRYGPPRGIPKTTATDQPSGNLATSNKSHCHRFTRTRALAQSEKADQATRSGQSGRHVAKCAVAHHTAKFNQAAYSGGTSSACRQTNLFCVLVRLIEYPELLSEGERSEEEEEEQPGTGTDLAAGHCKSAIIAKPRYCSMGAV